MAGLKAGSVITVGAIDGLKRLKSIVGLSISDSQMKDVEAIGRLRNRVAHFVLVDDDEVATRTQLARGLDFVVWFLQEHFQPGAPDAEATLISEVLSDLVEALVGIQQFVAERLVRIQSTLDSAELLLRCPACSQDTLDCSEEVEPRCTFCGWVSDGPGGADTYVDSVLGLSAYATIKDGGIWPIYTCPECSAQALVNGVEVKKNSRGGSPPYFLCFSCGYRAAGQDLTECSRCGELTQNEFGMCDDCIDYAVSRD